MIFTREPRSAAESTQVTMLLLLFWSHSLKLTLQLAGNGMHFQPCLGLELNVLYHGRKIISHLRNILKTQQNLTNEIARN